MANTKTHIRTTCSGCFEDVNFNRDTAKVIVKRQVGDLIDDDGDLVTWDCPSCGYADSFDLNYGEDE